MTPEISIRSFSDDQYTLDKVFYSNYYRVKKFEEESVAIDVGAHAGYFSMLCAMRGVKKIYNLEPFIENYKLLQKNTESFVERTSNLKLGIYTENKLAELAYPKFENNFFFFSKAHFDPEAELHDLCSFVTLDTFLESIKETKIDLLKINIGYAEIDILTSSNLLGNCEHICGETTESEDKITSLIESMKSKGYNDSYFAKSNEKENTHVFLFAKNKCDDLFDLVVSGEPNTEDQG